MDVPLLILDETWTSKPVTEFEEPIDCDIFDMVSESIRTLVPNKC